MRKYSRELKKKRFEKKIKKIFFFYFSPFILLLSLLIFAFNSEILSLKKIKIIFDNKEDVKYLNEEKILKEINSVLSEKYLFAFSKKNLIFFPENEINFRLEKKFPEIKKISLERGDLLENLKIKILEEKPNFIYCDNFKKKDCYFTNKDGKIFYKVKSFKESDFIILIADKKKETGSNFFVDKEEKEKITKLFVKLKENFKLDIEYFVKNNEYSYTLILKSGTKILLNNNFDLEKIIFKFQKIIKLKDFKIKSGVFVEDVKYINLSIKNRIPYCLGGNVCENNY